MEKGGDKYDKLLKVLRKSNPILDNAEDIENEVIKSISKYHRPAFNISDMIDFLFGWIYIGWVRRTLITASVCLVAVFVWQQGVMLKQINYLSKQIIQNSFYSEPDMIEKKLLMYRLSGKRFDSHTITIPEKQMNQLLDSINELQVKYKDLMDVIGEDPELKKYIEKKLSEINHTKTNL
jgi:hypothetical protein